MKLCNIQAGSEIHLAVQADNQVFDLNASGYRHTMEEVISEKLLGQLRDFCSSEALIPVGDVTFSNILKHPEKVVGVGLNYKAYAAAVKRVIPEKPLVFSKFSDSLSPCGAEIVLPEWETTYDYEGELVIVIGDHVWNVSEDEAWGKIFGYTIGNDLSCRDAQYRSGQFLIGKAMPGFAPCGPCITPADEFDPRADMQISTYVNGVRRQNGLTSDMIFDCGRLISYISKYIALAPGDLVFTGTPCGDAQSSPVPCWLKRGDTVCVEIESLGKLISFMA